MKRQRTRYHDRYQAGDQLADFLLSYAEESNVLVMALSPGGVPVAHEVAMPLEAKLDLFLVRQISVPGRMGLRMGAIASGDVTIRDREVLCREAISSNDFKREMYRESGKLLRRQMNCRGNHPYPGLEGRCVILVDEGLDDATAMATAVHAVRRQGAKRIVVAVPVAPEEVVDELRDVADEVVCPFIPLHFDTIGACYEEFPEVDDYEVYELLESARVVNHALQPGF